MTVYTAAEFLRLPLLETGVDENVRKKISSDPRLANATNYEILITSTRSQLSPYALSITCRIYVYRRC